MMTEGEALGHGIIVAADTDIAASLTKLASDYGPFLFAILFTLIVPIRAYQNFRDCAAKFPEPTATEQCLVRESELYFRSTWIAGFVLIAFSVGWWLYLNWDVLHHKDRSYWITYEGEISGVTPDDVLDAQQNAHTYMWAVDYPYRHYQFLVLTHAPVSDPILIPIYWLSVQQMGGRQSGYGPHSVSFKFDPKQSVYQFKRNGNGLTIVAGE
jgi:hypothetical protein